ncbi:MAG: hypothetical protein IH630_06965 [Thermoplasmata archaeon]|nr:hypothetical protein [Thermoplasmata archaeon]MCJ7561882.1 cyclophilin-like fold protein [Thermoplasmata archaeon]TFG69770.1 MAG: hypothetical protein E4H25_04010 [Methanomassiliicoccus sp.]
MDILCDVDGGISLKIRVREDATPTTEALLSALPFEGCASRWGDEVYFGAPFHTLLEEDARADMDVGEVAYWPDGDALALFFGKTPASIDDRPRAYSKCNVVGRMVSDPTILGAVRPGTRIRLSRL